MISQSNSQAPDGVGSNLASAKSERQVDELNAQFYGRILFPAAPSLFERLTDPRFWATMLGHDLGYWHESLVKPGDRVWVAGCGSNQAILTALKFPDAYVIGSDLSAGSLALCKSYAEQLELENLELRCENINDVMYDGDFQYVVCTGVIHHNADCAATLSHVRRSLAQDGLLEIMVYNQFHRVQSSALQRAIRMLAGTSHSPDLAKEEPVARALIENLDETDDLGGLRSYLRRAPYAEFADILLQPIEHSFTVASLDRLATQCGLQILSYVIDQFSDAYGRRDWALLFTDERLAASYEALEDVERWQLTNYLLRERSPMLWFYMQRTDSRRQRRSEKEVCEDFLVRPFKRNTTERLLYHRNHGGMFRVDPIKAPFPSLSRLRGTARLVYEHMDGLASPGVALNRLGLRLSGHEVNNLRIALTTTAYPFLSVA